jgi:hypothetical protein
MRDKEKYEVKVRECVELYGRNITFTPGLGDGDTGDSVPEKSVSDNVSDLSGLDDIDDMELDIDDI